MEDGRSVFKVLAGSPAGKVTRNLVDSAEDRDYSRALVNAALNLRFS